MEKIPLEKVARDFVLQEEVCKWSFLSYIYI